MKINHYNNLSKYYQIILKSNIKMVFIHDTELNFCEFINHCFSIYLKVITEERDKLAHFMSIKRYRGIRKSRLYPIPETQM